MKSFTYHARNNYSRTLKIKSNNKIIETPTYFPAISSVNNPHDIRSLLQLIIRSSFPQVLISVYDFDKDFRKSTKLKSSFKKYAEKYIVFLDSGGFEKYWKKDKTWTFQKYEKSIKKIESHLYTSFDGESKFNEKKFVERLIKSGTIMHSSQYLPIFHEKTPAKIIQILKKFLQKYSNGISFVAIREKECGSSVIERAKTIHKIRKVIDKEGDGQILHMLGTGNPLSIAFYSYCGADSFDSTDWYKYALDIKTLSLCEPEHLDILRCPCNACKKISNFQSKLLLHNLDSYIALMKKIRRDIHNSKLKALLIKNGIDKTILDQLRN